MALASSPMFLATLFTGATSGFFLETFCPENGIKQSWKMWLIIGLITLTSPILLFFLKDKLEITYDELVRERREKRNREKAKKYDNECIPNGGSVDCNNSSAMEIEQQYEFTFKN